MEGSGRISCAGDRRTAMGGTPVQQAPACLLHQRPGMRNCRMRLVFPWRVFLSRLSPQGREKRPVRRTKNDGPAQVARCGTGGGHAALDRGRREAGGVTAAGGERLLAVLVPGARGRFAGRGAERRLAGGIGRLWRHVSRFFGGGSPVWVASGECFGCGRERRTARPGVHVLVGFPAEARRDPGR